MMTNTATVTPALCQRVLVDFSRELMCLMKNIIYFQSYVKIYAIHVGDHSQQEFTLVRDLSNEALLVRLTA